MNKKFYTLVAGLLLASQMGTYAQSASPITTAISLTGNVYSGTLSTTPVQKKDATNPDGGYVKGNSYFLSPDGSNFLYVTDNNELKYGSYTLNSLDAVNKASWTLVDIVAPAGAVAPKYVFQNKATQAILSMNVSEPVKYEDRAKGSITLTEGQAEWLSAPSYTDPTTNSAIYAAAEDDQVVAFVKTGVNDGVTVAIMSRTDLDDATGHGDVIKIAPYEAGGTTGNTMFTLSPKQLNTMLGLAGENATEDSYFNLSFDPEATMNGEANLFGVDLQAQSVDQFELKWGEEADEADFTNDVIKASGMAGVYTSFYPTVKGNAGDSYAAHVKAENITAFNDGTAQWVVLRNRDGEYLVVDTAYVDGTDQTANKRMTFAWDGLYNAKNETRFRDPRSYLFRFDYNPTTGNVEIHSMAYMNREAGDNNASGEFEAAPYATDFDAADFYNAQAYASQPIQKGSVWYTYTATSVTPTANYVTASDVTSSYNRANDESFIIKAALGSVAEVTLGKPNASTEPNNMFAITLGHSEIYTPAYVASGAYLLKVTGSKVKDRIGKYYINNLKGGFEIMEQAVRQNFQDMPAAQWVVKSTGTTAGSPVQIVNREFTNEPNPYNSSAYTGVAKGGTPYGVAGAGDQVFFMGSDTLQFIPVTNAKDAKLGYKYVANDTIKESIFTFNYLHQLGMDRPINTVSDKDSVVWVDVDGNAIKFILERAIENDAYGTNLGLSNVAALTRDAYYIKVNDATKLENDKRYLCYDASKKKYVVSEKEQAKADKFFLKENNEVADGYCYYTLVTPNKVDVIEIPATVNLSEGQTIANENGYLTVGKNAKNIVYDNDVQGLFIATAGKVKDSETGRWDDGTVVKLFEYTTDQAKSAYWDHETYANNTSMYEVIYLDNSYTVVASSSTSSIKYYIVRYKADYSYFAENYANYKVSVDNNTLDLVNGVIYNSSYQEVANSAFAVVRDADPLYRRFNTALEAEEESDAPKNLNFFRVNATEKEYLYEDATSNYSKDLNFNFLGVEDKGVIGKNPSIFVDTAYVRNNTSMPQYLLALRPDFVEGDTILCDATTHEHATEEDALACSHSKITKPYIDAYYLVNLQDSVEQNAGKAAAKYQWNQNYTRLGFVKARHISDTLVIDNSVFTGNMKKLNPNDVKDSTTIASKDSIFLGDNNHNNVKFSFRIVKSGSNDFLIESEGDQIAPEKGGWVKIQNGVPVIAKYDSYKEAGLDAEIFNVEKATQDPTANEAVDATEVSIIAVKGGVQVRNAAGKQVKVYTILGQQLANQTVTSDSETIAVPAGIVAVSVDGAEAVKVIVK